MSDMPQFENGTIVWKDLTVDNAEEICEFYHQVVGWSVKPVPMEGYNDYSAYASAESAENDGESVAGICHARGPNSSMPPLWLFYVKVEDIDQSISKCLELGGEVVREIGKVGPFRFCVVRDPAGAVIGLISS